MGFDRVKLAAAASLLVLVGLSLTLFAGSQVPPTPPGIAPVDGTGLPPDHPPVKVESAPLFEARFESLQARLADDAEDSGAILEMGNLLQDAHRPLEAADFYEQFLAAHPDSAEVWLYLANAYGTAAQWLESADASARMLERLPEHGGGLYNMGAALANQGKYTEARQWWQRALRAGDPIIASRAEASLGQLPSS